MSRPAGLPDAFAGASNTDGIFGFPHIRVGQPVWLGLPVMPLKLNRPVRILSAQVVGSLPVRDVRFFDAPLYGANRGRHVTILIDPDFRSYGFVTDGSLVGETFAPGSATHYGLVRLTFTRPGKYVVNAVRIEYESGGRRGSQIVRQIFELGVQ